MCRDRVALHAFYSYRREAHGARFADVRSVPRQQSERRYALRRLAVGGLQQRQSVGRAHEAQPGAHQLALLRAVGRRVFVSRLNAYAVLAGSNAVDDVQHTLSLGILAADASVQSRHILIAVVVHAVNTHIVVELRLLMLQRLEPCGSRLAAEAHYRRVGAGAQSVGRCLYRRDNPSLARRHHEPSVRPEASRISAMEDLVAHGS